MTALADAERLDRWRHTLAASFRGLSPRPWDDHAPHGEVIPAPLGIVEAFQVSGNQQVLSRKGRAQRNDPTDPLKLCLQVRGSVTVHQGGAEVHAEPGQFVLYDLARPYALGFTKPWVAAVAAFPRRALGLSESQIRSAMQRPHDACHGAGAVLAGFLDHAVQQADQLRSHDAGRLGEAGLSILDAALTDRAPNSSAPHVLVAQARAYIRRHLVDPGLNIESVAGHHHVSVRTLQRAFAADGQTVTELIRTLRLHALRQDLANPRLVDRSIAALAARWCFTDASHLNHLFHATYGLAPSDVRRAAG